MNNFGEYNQVPDFNRDNSPPDFSEYAKPQNSNPFGNPPAEREDSTFTFGLVAIITTFVAGFPIGLIFAIIALNKAKQARLGGYATRETKTGRTLAMISLIYSIVVGAMIVLFFAIILPLIILARPVYYW